MVSCGRRGSDLCKAVEFLYGCVARLVDLKTQIFNVLHVIYVVPRTVSYPFKFKLILFFRRSSGEDIEFIYYDTIVISCKVELCS